MPTRDDSAYVLMHDDMFDHPKFEGLTDAAIVLFWRHITTCHRLRTDGTITRARWAKIGKPRHRAELLQTVSGQTAPLVHQYDDRYEIHDYLDWQQSSAEIEAAQARSSVSGSLGNHRRWHTARGKTDPNCRFCTSPPDRHPDHTPDRVPDRGPDIAPISPPRITSDIGASRTRPEQTKATTTEQDLTSTFPNARDDTPPAELDAWAVAAGTDTR